MSDKNTEDGFASYMADNPGSRAWFHDQWYDWPIRTHPDKTTNLSFHHGGILAFRQLNGSDPEMSGHLRGNIQFLEGMKGKSDE